MNVKCPCCSHKFPVTEDDVLLDYDADYNNSEVYVWENLPLLRSSWDFLEENQEEVNG